MDQVKMGSFLKELRNEKELTQGQLAERLNVSNRSVSRWETGSTLPDISILVELAQIYEVDLTELIDGERKSEIMSEEMLQTLEKVGEYTSEEKKQIINLLKIVLMFSLFAFTFIYMLFLCGIVGHGVIAYIIQAISMGGMYASFYGIVYMFQLHDSIKKKTAVKLRGYGFVLFYIIAFIIIAVALSELSSLGLL